MLLLLLMLATACNDSSKEEAEDFPPRMKGSIEIDGVQFEMQSGGYRWQRKVGFDTQTVQTDHASPYQMAEHIKPITLTSAKTAIIHLPKDPKISVYLWNEKGREKQLAVTGQQLSLPSETGKYIYEVFAEWSNGEISFVFVIDVKQ
jgi:hypothetical protein